MVNNLALPMVAQQWVERIGGPRRAMFVGAGAGSVLLILGLAHFATRPTWVPVYSDLPLESVGKITERLDEEAIPYRLESGGSELQVDAAELARARVALAQGGLPSAGRPGLELFDQPSWGMTDFTQRINYRRALEGELERTIGEMRGVDAAKVHLALEETAGFRRAGRPAEASVVLSLQSGDPPTEEVVQGIAHLVASSVDGVEPERVTVLDDRGRLLSNPWEPDSPPALASRELKMRSEIEKYLQAKAEQIVAQMVGPGNARVQVSAEMNLDRVERTVETVDPERQVLSSEQRSEIIPGPQGGAGSTSVTASYLNSRSVETYAGAVGNVKRLTVAVLVNERVGEGGAPQPRTPEELARMEALIQSAIGFNPARGDVVSVVSVPFQAPPAPPEEGMDLVSLAQQWYRPVVVLLALLFAFIIGLRVTRSMRAPEEAAKAALPAGEAAVGATLEGTGDPADLLAALGAPAEDSGPKPPTLREQVVALVEAEPDSSLRLLREWMKES
jgi:flagellar M-ring protein FliF